MGGHGSGRPPSTETIIKRMQQPFHPGADMLTTLPNYSGIQKEVFNKNTGLTSGGVIFTDDDGTLTSESTEFFYDKNNNTVGIGTNSPTASTKLDVRGIASGTIARFASSANSVAMTVSDDLSVNIRNAASSTIFQAGTAGNNWFTVVASTQPRVLIANAASFGYSDAYFSRGGVGIVSTTSSLSLGTGALTSGKLNLSGGSCVISNTTAPATPTNAGALFVSGGECWYIGSSGTQTRLGVA